LIAKNGGQERTHHFAHDGGTVCEGGTETAIHLAAKQIIADYKRVALPFTLGEVGRESIHIAEFESVQLEYELFLPSTQRRIVADCYGCNGDGPVIIEIAVHHRVDIDKAIKVDSLGICAIEIDLSDKIGKMLTWNDLENAVLFDANRRRWILAPQLQQEISVAEEAPSVATPLMTPNSNEWRFAIGTTWIWVKELPFGNIRVFHRYDEHVRRIVEPICRSRGYWNGQYKNWIVFDRFKAELLESLASQAQSTQSRSQ
jgi:hypothetical protein